MSPYKLTCYSWCRLVHVILSVCAINIIFLLSSRLVRYSLMPIKHARCQAQSRLERSRVRQPLDRRLPPPASGLIGPRLPSTTSRSHLAVVEQSRRVTPSTKWSRRVAVLRLGFPSANLGPAGAVQLKITVRSPQDRNGVSSQGTTSLARVPFRDLGCTRPLLKASARTESGFKACAPRLHRYQCLDSRIVAWVPVSRL